MQSVCERLAGAKNRRIRKMDASGIISTVAGVGKQAFSGDGGPATSAEFVDPRSVVVEANGNLLIADVVISHRIRKVDTSGIINTVAGNGCKNPICPLVAGPPAR